MLNKSKSNKLNLFKYVIVTPILAIFLMSFNTETIYVEKEIQESKSELHNLQKSPISQTHITESTRYDLSTSTSQNDSNTLNQKSYHSSSFSLPNNSANKEKIEFTVTKISSDNDLSQIVKRAEKYGLTISFKGIKRNEKGEITSIKIVARSESSNTNFDLNSDESIQPIIIAFNKDSNKLSIGNVSIQDGGANAFVWKTKTKKNNSDSDKDRENVFIISEEDEDFNITKSAIAKVRVMSTNDIDEDIEILLEEGEGKNPKELHKKVIIIKEEDGKKHEVESLDLEEDTNHIIISSNDDKDDDPLFIIDGKEVSKGITEDLKPENIESINVLKGDSAKEKYGEKGKNGVIEIISKKI